jgi:hypothetical protein
MAKAKSKSARPAAAPKGRTTAKGPAKTAARNIGVEPGAAKPSASAKDAAAKAVGKPAAAKPAAEKTAKAADPDTIPRKTAAADASSRAKPAATKRTTPTPSSRYTPPVPKSEKISPLWVPILMFACLGIGMAIIILNYVNVLPGPDPSNVYLMIGLGLITVGFITATKYH